MVIAEVTKPTAPQRPKPDFCQVQLSESGAALAAGSPLRYSNGTAEYYFRPGEPQKIARYEWNMSFAGHVTPSGDPLFILVGEPVPVQPTATATVPVTDQTSAVEETK